MKQAEESKSPNTTSEPNFNISVTFRHSESTPALKSYAIDKISHCLRKYLSYEANVDIVLLVEKRDHIAEAKLHSKGYDISAKAVTGDLYSAIDKVVDNIDRQVRKQKEQRLNHKHQGASAV